MPTKLRSIRLSTTEDNKLKALALAGHFDSVTAFIRHQLGLNPVPTDLRENLDMELTDARAIMDLMVQQSKMTDEILRGMKRIGKSLGVDTATPALPAVTEQSKLQRV